MRASLMLSGAMLLASSPVAAQQPPPATMSPGEIPPGYAFPPGVTPTPPPLPPGWMSPSEIPPGVPVLTPPDLPPPRRYRNKGMMIAGIVFVSIGATAFLAGPVYIVTARCPPGSSFSFCGLGHALVGTLVMGGGMVVGGALGAPLFAVGAGRPPEADRAAWVPSVVPGPRSASLRWTF